MVDVARLLHPTLHAKGRDVIEVMTASLDCARDRIELLWAPREVVAMVLTSQALI